MTSSFPTLAVFVQALAESFWEALTNQHYPWDFAGGKQSLEVAQFPRH